MPIASGTRVRLAQIVETTRGETPSTPTLSTIRATSRNVNLTKRLLESEEVRSDRQVSDARHGFNSVEGSVGFELTSADFDELIASAMAGSWGNGGAVTGTPSLEVGAGEIATLTRDTGSWLTDGFLPGDVVETSDFTTNASNNQARVLILSVDSATQLTIASLSQTAFIAETDANATITRIGQRVQVGTTLTTHTIERAFLDIDQYEVYRGVAVQSMSLNVEPEQIVSGEFGLVGMSSAALAQSTIANAITDASTNSPYAPFDGGIYIGGERIGVVTGIDFTLENNRSVEAVVGSKFSPDVFEGVGRITGNARVFFEDETFKNRFVNETEGAIALYLNNTDDFFLFFMPRVKFNSGDIDPGQTGPVVINASFVSLVDSVAETTMLVTRSNS